MVDYTEHLDSLMKSAKKLSKYNFDVKLVPLAPQKFQEQLNEFVSKTKELRLILGQLDKDLNNLDDKLKDTFTITDNFAMMHCHTRKDTLIKRDYIRNQLKEYEKIIQRLKSTL